MMQRWLIRLTLISFGLFLAITLAEFALEKMAPHPATFRHGYHEPDEHLGWKGIPGKQAQFKIREIVSQARINSHGFRDRERSNEKKKESFRIIVLGDSFTAGDQVYLEQTFPYLLEERLNSQNGRLFEVINLGVDGFGTAQEYLTLKHYGLRYQPDLIVLAFYTGNDVVNNSLVLQSRAAGLSVGADPGRPYFRLNNGRLEQVPFNVRVTNSSSTGGQEIKHGSVGQFKRVKDFLQQLYPNVYYSLSDAADAMPWLANVLWQLGIKGTKSSSQAEPFQSCYRYAEEYPPEWEEAWRITKALLIKISNELAEKRIGFFVVVVPDEQEFRPDVWGRASCAAMKNVKIDLKKPERLLSQFLNANQIRHLQLRPEIEKHYVATGERLYFPYFYENHWNASGHALAAELIYQKLTRGGLIPHDNHPGACESVVEKMLSRF